MSHSLPRLIAMANQIARAFARLPEDQAISEVSNHIKSFWEKRMLRQIFDHLATGGAGLERIPQAALARLRDLETVSK